MEVDLVMVMVMEEGTDSVDVEHESCNISNSESFLLQQYV
jgi:hypothetical protein